MPEDSRHIAGTYPSASLIIVINLVPAEPCIITFGGEFP